uniref:Histidine decarboxylase n=1 Tax=Xiphophorus couchianus TaxID=32473 RepID=A0A3B5KP61_9TELE
MKFAAMNSKPGIDPSTVSEGTLVALLAARKDKILQLKTELDQEVDDSVLNSTLVAYASDQAHSSVEKAGLIALVKIRFLPADEKLSLRGETLKQAIQEDRRRGLVPFMVYDGNNFFFFNTGEEEGLWLHVDAAYAGSAYFCPELRWSLEGIEFAESFVFNPSKWMMVHFDCTAFWVKNKHKLQQTFSVDPVYLRHENSRAATDFMHWQIPLSRRFRSLKLWFVMRSFGLKNLQAHVRHGIEMAKLLESHIRSDPNFEVPAERHLGLVVFCLKGGNALTQELLRRLTRSGTMYLIPAEIHTKRIIRFTVTSQFTTADDILKDWAFISKTATTLLAEKHGFNKADQLRYGEPKAAGKEENPDPHLDAMIDLWIDKAWNRPRRPMRSLSCSSEPLPYWALFTTESGPVSTLAEMPSSLPRKQVLKKLTKFYSVPSFCNQWAQCSRHPVNCPLKVAHASQKPLSSSCRRVNCMLSSPAANMPSTSPLESANGAEPQ